MNILIYNRMDWLDPVFMDLWIFLLLPLLIELILPEQTWSWIHLMIAMTIWTFEDVGAWFALFGFETRGVCFCVSFTTLAKLMVVFWFMRAITLDIFGPLYFAWKNWMSLSPTVFILRNTRISVSSSYCSDKPSNIKAPINEVLSFHAALSISYVNPDDGYVWFGRYFNNS